jgi:hypothetical protein
MGLRNRSLSYFPLIFFKKNRTSLYIQISFTLFGCFQPLEKRTSRKNSDVVGTLTKGRKLLHVFTGVFRLKYSRSVLGEKTPWGNFSPKIFAGGEIFDFSEDSAPLIPAHIQSSYRSLVPKLKS